MAARKAFERASTEAAKIMATLRELEGDKLPDHDALFYIDVIDGVRYAVYLMRDRGDRVPRMLLMTADDRPTAKVPVQGWPTDDDWRRLREAWLEPVAAN
jgi:hypothetical protein